ncbi:MAG: hypothetical protein ACKV19_28895 [Verrucomicrobiales bacterium]
MTPSLYQSPPSPASGDVQSGGGGLRLPAGVCTYLRQDPCRALKTPGIGSVVSYRRKHLESEELDAL